MIKTSLIALFVLNLVALKCNKITQIINSSNYHQLRVEIKLPDPVLTSDISIEEALLKRRSVRNYSNEPLELKDLAQLLWAAQGITAEENDGSRTAPSAGALYPLEIFVACGNVNQVTPGVYHYQPKDHLLQLITEGDKRKSLTNAAFAQGALNRSAAVIVIAADYTRTTGKYPERGTRYVNMEAGHAAQNIYLQAVSLHLGTVTIGSFEDGMVKQILYLPGTLEPLYLMPVGKRNK